jgi:phosphohistidine phosphatase
MSALRLYLLRHARASAAEPGMADFDRPLSERGRRDAEATAALFSDAG